MTRDQVLPTADMFAFPYLACCEILCALDLALWKALVEPFCPSAANRPSAEAHGQLVIPEPIAENDEHGLFA